MQPVNAFFEERIAAGHRLVVAPVVGRLQALDDAAEMAKDHLTDHVVGQQLAECDRERLVMVVLANQHHPAGAVAGFFHNFVVAHGRERRLLDQHVLAGGKRLQGEVQVKRRRHRDDDRVDVGIGNGGGVIAVATGAAVLATKLAGLGLVSAGVAADDLAPEAPQVAAVHAGDEAAAQEGDAEGCWHRRIHHTVPSGITRRMRPLIHGTVLSIVLGGSLFAQAPAAQAPPAPAPGSPATFKSAKELADVLKAVAANPGGMTTSAVSNTDQYRINVVHRVKPAGALAHAGNTELHYIIDGSATVVTGGTIVRGATPATATIANGVTQKVAKGDVVIVPANSPHWYSVVDGSVTYLEVRWLAPAK